MGNRAKGVLCVLAASVAYGVMPVFSKFALAEGMAAGAVVFWRFALSAVFALLFVLKSKFHYLTRAQLVHLLVFGILGFGMTINLLTTSYQYLPTGVATIFHFAYPLFIILAMAALYKEKITWPKAVACLLALAGIALLADFSGGLSLPGVLLALGSAVTYAAFVIASRKSSFAVLPPVQVILFVSGFSAVVFGVKGAAVGELRLPPTAKAWGCLVVISLLCTVFALASLTQGIRLLGASTASVLNMLEPITSVVCGVLVFSEPLGLRTLAGCALVLLATGFVILGDRGPGKA